MRPRPKHVLVALIASLLILFAYAPLLRAGLLAEDYGILLNLGSTGGAEVSSVLAPKPLTVASLHLSKTFMGFPPELMQRAGAGMLRAEQLAYLLCAALGLGCFVRRLLLPWSGSEQATGSGRAAALLFAVHPLAVWTVAQVAARGDLLGLMFAIWSAYLFLRGRQDRVAGWTAAALLLAIAAGFASHLALGLPPLLFASDLVSTHRYRPLRTRLRTASTTLLLFSVGVSLDYVRVFVQAGGPGMAAPWAPLLEFLKGSTAAGSLSLAAETLGLLILPVNSMVVGFAGIAFAGAVFLIALQPALNAARSAPRLWGWLLGGWLLALAVSQALHLKVRIAPDDLAHMHAALPSVAVMAAGLGLCATALSGPRRPYTAWIVVVAYACLGHANARPWPGAARDAANLRRDLFAAHDFHGRMRTLVLDAPEAHQGVQGVGSSLAYLAHPALQSSDVAVAGAPELPEIRRMSTAAFLAFLGEPEFQAWLGEEILLLYPYEALGESASGLLEKPPSGAGLPGGLMDRPYSVFRPMEPSTGAKSWVKSLSSPALDLSPQHVGALRVTLSEGRDPREFGRVSWRSRGEPDRGSHGGTWTTGSTGYVGRGGVVGFFDLGASLAWRTGGRVRAMLFEHGSHAIDTATLLAGLPGLGDLHPEPRAGDWVFPAPEQVPGFPAGVWRLWLLDMEAFELREFPVSVGSGGSLRAVGVEDYRDGMRYNGTAAEGRERSAPLGWILEYVVSGRVVARERGRL